MVAIVSGSALGLGLGSQATLGMAALGGQAAMGRSGELSFVNAATGNLVLQAADDGIVGRGLDHHATRTYNSQGLLNDDNGDNWSSGFFLQQLAVSGAPGDNALLRTARDGAVSRFVFDSARGVYVSSDGAGAFDTVSVEEVTGDRIWRDGDTGREERYAAATGRLTGERDAHGNAIVYTYNAAGRLASVQSANGETVHYDYVGNNLSQIRTVTTVPGSAITTTRVRYAYDASIRLSEVTVDLTPDDGSVADGKVYRTTYAYDGTSRRVTSVVQSDGSRLTIAYVQVGGEHRVARVEDALGNATRFAYDTATRRTTVTDALGFQTLLDHDSASRLVGITSPATGGVSQFRAFVYDAQGNLVETRDGENRAVVMAYDANGNLLSTRDAAGNTVTRVYDMANQLLVETLYATPDPDGAGAAVASAPLSTRYVRSQANPQLMRFALTPEGRVTEHRYNAYGERVASIEYLANLYPVAALAPATVPSEAQLMAWVATTDRTATSRIDREYDVRGQLQKVTTYSSIDASGNGVRNGSESVQRYIHDASGLLLQTVSPSGGNTLYSYDGLRRRLTETDALSHLTVIQYDDAGNKTSTTAANGLVTTRTFDPSGRLTTIQQSTAAGSNLGIERYHHDADGRLLMTQDATGARTWAIHDEAGRKVGEVDGNGSLTEYRYDRNDRLTLTVRYATAVNLSLLVTAGGVPTGATLAAVKPADSAADQKEWRIHDAAGRLVKTVDRRGSVRTMTYDGASRLVKTMQHATLVSTAALTSTPDAASVNPAAHPDDRTERHFHDADGRLLATLDATGHLSENTYDGGGRLVTAKRYANVSPPAQWTAGTLAQLRPAASANDIASTFLYDAQGRSVAIVDAEKYLTEKVYDVAGNLAQTIRYANRVSATVTSGVSVTAIRPAANAQDQVSTWTYDALNHVTRHVDAEGTATTYTYDNAGQLVSTTRAAGLGEARTVSSRFDVQGRRVGELSAEGAALITGSQTQSQIDAIWSQHGLVHTYDAAGRRTSTIDAAGSKTLLFYNADDQLQFTIDALGEVEENVYNALDQLTSTIRYAARISLAGLSGGLTTSTLRSTVDAVKSAALDSRVEFTYDAAGNRATSKDALANVTTRTFNAFGEEATRTSPQKPGVTLVESFTYDRRGRLAATTRDAGGIGAVETTTYDAFGRAVSEVDANGKALQRTYDRLGRVITTTDRASIGRSATYDAFDRVLTQTDGLGKTTTYAYDKTERSVTVTTPEGVKVKTVRTRHGQTHSVTDGRNQATSYTYDRNGNLRQSSLGGTSETQIFDRANRLIETIDRNNVRVVFTYDAAHRMLTRRVDPDGLDLQTTYSYDAKGQQLTITEPGGTVTGMAYDLGGRVLTRTVDPGGLALTTTYTYDAQGRVLSVKSPASTVTEYTYDKLGRRIKEEVDPAGLKIARSYSYDDNGNVVSSTDPNSGVTRYAYDAEDRLRFTVDAAGNATQTVYDAEGRVSRITRHAAPISLAGLPNPASLADISARIVVTAGKDAVDARRYDADGRLTFTVDGTGAVVRRWYDGNGNVVKTTAYVNAIAPASWTGAADPVVTADAVRDRTTQTVYDALDRATHTADATGAVTRREYDGNGNVLKETRFATPVSSAASPAAVVAHADDRTTTYVYDKANRVRAKSDATGAVEGYRYDDDGNRIEQRLYAARIAAGAAPTSVAAGALDRITTNVFDRAGRLTYSVNGERNVSLTTYDKDGRVASVRRYLNAVAAGAAPGSVVVHADDRLETFTHDLAGRLKTTKDSLNQTESFTYDGLGNKLTFTSKKGSVWTYAYDAAGRMVSEKTPGVDLVSMVPNATTGQLTGTLTAGVSIETRFAYDGLGNLIARHEAVGRPEARTTSYEYDSAGRQVKVTFPPIGSYAETAAVRLANASLGAAARVETTKTPITRTLYNAFGEAVANVDRHGATSLKSYDAEGRVEYEVDALGFVTGYDRNAFGEATATTRYAVRTGLADTAPASGAVAPSSSQIAAAVDPAGAGNRTLVTLYDKAGRVAQVSEPATYTFDSTTGGYDTYGRTTQNAYNAFGDLVRSSRLANRDTGSWLHTYNYVDLAGRSKATIDPAGYLTRRTFDALGNLSSTTEYATALAAASWNYSTSGAPVAAADDRTTNYTYDRLDRKTSETRVNVYYSDDSAGGRVRGNVQTTYGYDAVGNLTRTTDAYGGNTYSYYDALGRVKAVAAPRRTSTMDGTATSPVTAFWRDAHGNVTQQIERANAPTVVNETAYAVARNAALDRITETLHDASGNVLNVEDALGYVTFNSYTTDGRLAKTWRTATGHDGVGKTIYTAYAYDRVGQVTRIYVPKASDGTAIETRMTYNAFGEVVGKGINGEQESFEYDNAGNLWRTNSGSGKHRIFLYDLLGRATAEIGSAGVGRGDVDMGTATSAAQAAGWASVRRSDTKYDALGNAIQVVEPERLVKQGGVSIRQATASASISSSNGFQWIAGVNSPMLAWDGVANSVSATWTNLAYLGSGDVKVEVHYKSKDIPYSYAPNIIWQAGTSRIETQIFEAHLANAGATVTWNAEGGIQAINKLVVYKKNVNGEWVPILNRGSFGAYGTFVEAGSPIDPSTTLQLKYKLSTATTWSTATTYVFGDSHWFDASGLASGTYQYEVYLTEFDEAAKLVTSGSFVTGVAETDAAAISAWVRPVVNRKFDRWGNTLETSDARNATWVTQYQYDANNRVIYERKPDTAGNSSSSSPSLYTYFDRLGRKVAERDAMGNYTGWVYDAGGNVVEQRSADGGVVKHRYDAFDDRRRTLDALANASGAPAATISDHTTEFAYDNLGRLLRVKHGTTTAGSTYVYSISDTMTVGATPTRKNIEETYTYDELARRLTATNGATEITKYAYDAGGNVIQTIHPMAQQTTAKFDAFGRKVAQTDANGNSSTWTYSYFGTLTAHKDLGGSVFAYTYDHAGQLVNQTNDRGLKLEHLYDAAGQLARITDTSGVKKTTTYAYDEAGNRLREKVLQGSEVFQDNHLSYDTLGRLRDSADNRARLAFTYDKNGNRTRLTTRVYVAQVNDDDVETLKTDDRFFQYDAMNRQIVVDAIDAAGTAGANTHKLTYDLNGNRLTDTFTGNKVTTNETVLSYYDLQGRQIHQTFYSYRTSTGPVTEKYSYDALDRLKSIERDGIQLDLRLYDGAGRIIQSGPDGTLPRDYASALNSGLAAEDQVGLETRRYRYDANGRLVFQKVLKSDNDAKHDISYERAVDGAGVQIRGYDEAGNVVGYRLKNYSGDNYTQDYTTTSKRFEGYVADVSTVKRSGHSDGKLTHGYDANGHLVTIADSKESTMNRTIVNDAAGRGLKVTQGANVLYTHIVNDEMLGRYGVGIHDVKPRKSNGDANFMQIADFDLGYRSINGSYPTPSLGQYEVRQGDTLRSIAQGAYGDSGLWWRIAEANNLSSDSDLRVGQTLTIANKVANVGNMSGTFKPYDASEVIGDTTPTLGKPKGGGGCGGMGQVLMIAVAIVVTVYTAGALTSTTAATFGQTMAAGANALAQGAIAPMEAAIAGMAGSVASQAVGVAAGVHQRFDWNGVALSAAGSAISASLPTKFGTLGTVRNAVVKAAITNAVTQGIGVVTGLQNKFAWRGVAASAVGAGVGHAVGPELAKSITSIVSNAAVAEVTTRFATGMAAGATAAVVRGGRIAIQQVAVDAFGNALGSSVVDAMHRIPEVQLPEAVAKEAESNPAVAALYRETVANFRSGGIADDKAQELVLRVFDLRNSEGNAQVLDAYKLDVLMAKGASAESARALLNYMGLSTNEPELRSMRLSAGDFGGTEPGSMPVRGGVFGKALDTMLPPVTVTGARGSGFSATGRFLFDWQDELAAVGMASQKLGQWMGDNPALGWGLMAVQAATTPLLFAGQQVLQRSPLGEKLDALTSAAFEEIGDFVYSEGAIGDRGKAALMTIGGIGVLSLAVGGLGMLRHSVNTASMFAKQLEQRHIELNFDRDGGIDPHVIDSRILAQQRLGQMQQRFTQLMAKGDAHFLTKHGPQTSLTDQYERATAGWPNKHGKLVTADASRFFNPEDMEDAIRQAMAQFKANPQQSIEVPMGKPIGEGFMRAARLDALPDYRRSNIVRVNFDMKAGLPYTAFPDIVRNGVTLPVPKF